MRKGKAHASALSLDGDYGEEQITLVDPAGFDVGDGVAIWDKNAGGFHTTVARITGKNGNIFSISLPLNADCMAKNSAEPAPTDHFFVNSQDAGGLDLRQPLVPI